MLDIVFDLVCDVCDFLDWWRFGLCLLFSLAVIGLTCWLIANEGARLALCVPVAVLGLGSGVLWEWSARS